MTEIYCDGACRGNPGLAGSGIYVLHEGKETFMAGGYEESGTNNTAELKAFIHSLKIAERIGAPCVIKADSKYVINSITDWAYTWKKNSWKKKGGIKNLELIQEAHELYDLLKENLSVEYVKGHAGIDGNEFADQMANYAIDNKIVYWTKIEQ